LRSYTGFIEILANKHDFCAIVPNGMDFLRRRIFRHEYHGRYVEKPGSEGDPLAMVSR